MTTEQQIKITKTQARGRKVEIDAFTLVSTIAKLTKKDYVNIKLGNDKELAIDTVTGEILYFNDRTCEESYLDKIVFSEY